MNLNNLVRPNILNLKPYASARDEFQGEAAIFLDANENSLGSVNEQDWNRYPDPQQRKVKDLLAGIKGVQPENIFLGNGSDEAIDILFRVFCEPGKDQALTFSPTYGMYEVSANINNVEIIQRALDKDFQPRVEDLVIPNEVKLVFICSPNNPTGNSIKPELITRLLDNFKGILVLDEAYIDYAADKSWLPVLLKYPKLVILQTFSKAWGLAALRLGVAYASAEIVSLMNKVKPPYNINAATQELALNALQNVGKLTAMVQETIRLRTELIHELKSLSVVKYIYPSETNFVLTEVSDAPKIYQYLVGKGIVVRNRHSVVNNCLRITVGNQAENQQLISALKSYDY